ncbi:hypothetical protein HPB50_013572 [Hyalomma asiaticum]|uniref:Uncharacterized protein n=1 Tax=Hyalomma asiaticum TaxID=266040 RepID=A0ACB7RQU9_HYAAI|nr:hypothetical protein HPB50_013572 [Hyalomma asiaticum]
MLGFPPGFSTQDVLLQLYHDLLSSSTSSDMKALLSLDLHKAFDQVSYSGMLTELGSLSPGARIQLDSLVPYRSHCRTYPGRSSVSHVCSRL